MNGVSIFNLDEAKFTNLAILGTACFVCQNIPDELLRCKKCWRVSYRSAACQAVDSEQHRKICLPLQLAPSSTPPSSRRVMFESWRYRQSDEERKGDISFLHITEKKMFLEMVGENKCSIIHHDLLLYGPRCAVCLRSANDMRNVYDPEYSTLLHCLDCRAAFACSEDHRTQYAEEHGHELEDGEEFTECELNKRAYEHSLEIVARGWTKGETLWFPARHKTDYTPLPSSWEEWFADPANLCPPDSSPVLNRIRTKQLSIPMTILYGLELFDKAAGDLPLLTSRTELEIAVIGPMEYELKYGGLACFEEILHALPSLRRLTVRFIGLELVCGLIGKAGVIQEAKKWYPCAVCKEKGVELVPTFHPQLFHEYVKEPMWIRVENPPAFRWPDLAVAFNSGMGLLRRLEKSSWSPTLKLLAENGVPTLCTSFLKRESLEDEDCLKMQRCNIVIERQKNPWRSEVLTKMVYTWKGFFTYNGFLQGFRGLREGEENSEEGASPPIDIDEEQMIAMMMELFPSLKLTLEAHRE
ncbi:hypothetical protein SCHPADRAFT_510742 [Schizopora paradoxa]|uniref:MYND-type domain-containing protein n=1 Tax=Schizopora paradoxa TaxID=27342 RepID=A0A0H2S0P8_9AGAM|nr:hypothetical protein SCHPADRAFT_510742 [Schizopora paradoxa]